MRTFAPERDANEALGDLEAMWSGAKWAGRNLVGTANLARLTRRLGGVRALVRPACGLVPVVEMRRYLFQRMRLPTDDRGREMVDP